MPLIPVNSADDPRLADYRALKDRDIAREGRKFIAEGEQLVRRLLASSFAADSLLLARRRAAEIAPLAPPDLPVFVLPDEAMSPLIGFKFHAGVLAVGRRGPRRNLDDVLANHRDPGSPLSLLVLPDTNNAANLGTLIRLAAGFACDAVLLGEHCADPFFRQSLRVSMGAVLTLPIIQSDDLSADLIRLRRDWRVTLIASVLDPSAVPLESATRPRRWALLLDGEAHGLSAATVAACDRRITIPMGWQTDSLNVAVAAAVMLYHFKRVAKEE